MARSKCWSQTFATTAVSRCSTAPQFGGVLPTVGQLAVPVRRALGDPTPVNVQRTAVAKFTHGSLAAMHEYAAARDLMDEMDAAGATKALMRVLELDPTLDAAY